MTRGKTAAFDQEAFAAAVSGVIIARGLTDGQAASQIGVAPSTIVRVIRQGNRPDVDTLALIVDWARLPADAFIIRNAQIAYTTAVHWRHLIAAMRASQDVTDMLRGLIGMPE